MGSNISETPPIYWSHNIQPGEWGGSDGNYGILEARDGTLWFGCTRALQTHRDGVWKIYRSPDLPVPQGRIGSLLEASDGALWVAAGGQEVVRLDCGTSRWTTLDGLWFQCELSGGLQWFLSEEGRAVQYDGKTWTAYGVEDGLMDAPVALLAAQDGTLWAAGSHEGTAATARFDGQRWVLQIHPALSWGIDWRAVYTSLDGSLWFGAAESWFREKGQVGGALQFDGRTWRRHTQMRPPAPYGIGQTTDGTIWAGGWWGLHRFDGYTWSKMMKPEELAAPFSDVLYTTPEGELWVGTRLYGAFHYDGKKWTGYDVRDGLADNRIRNILQTTDGSVWVGTAEGISRFDEGRGRRLNDSQDRSPLPNPDESSREGTWLTHALPPEFSPNIARKGLRQSRDGSLWINLALSD